MQTKQTPVMKEGLPYKCTERLPERKDKVDACYANVQCRGGACKRLKDKL